VKDVRYETANAGFLRKWHLDWHEYSAVRSCGPVLAGNEIGCWRVRSSVVCSILPETVLLEKSPVKHVE
jgi:hypothetical protein